MTPPATDVAIPMTSRNEAHRARCPECAWREGPFISPRDAATALIGHVETTHRGIAAIVRGQPYPEHNETFARHAVVGLLKQSANIDRLLSGSRIIGPNGGGAQIDLAGEMVRYIRGSSAAMMAILDLLLDMRTGRPELRSRPADAQEQQAEHAAEAAAAAPPTNADTEKGPGPTP